ncbi:MAG: hypothetical protein MUC29_03450 [Pyrinomonadaceae bacterium]|jgi:predicted membrane protein|nr:hypothetical protein [Pyrinomonadaceae bacterium]
MEKQIDNIRENTLTQIEKNEKNYKYAFIGAAVIEMLLIATFLLLADFTNRTHTLLLIVTIATYTIIGFGLMALGSHINRNTLRILQAIQISNENEN